MRYKLLNACLYSLAAVLALAGLCRCTPSQHTMRAPHQARHTYHKAERRNERTRAHVGKAPLYWN